MTQAAVPTRRFGKISVIFLSAPLSLELFIICHLEKKTDLTFSGTQCCQVYVLIWYHTSFPYSDTVVSVFGWTIQKACPASQMYWCFCSASPAYFCKTQQQSLKAMKLLKLVSLQYQLHLHQEHWHLPLAWMESLGLQALAHSRVVPFAPFKRDLIFLRSHIRHLWTDLGS